MYYGRYKVTQPYKGVDHQGIDLVGLDHKTIRTPVEGLVIAAQKDTYFDGGMGNYVKIRDKLGRNHLFAHLGEFLCSRGQMVNVWDKIGVEGNTGHSFGSHCHYEIRASNSAASHINVAEIMGILNKIGIYEGIEMEKDDAKKIVKEKADLSDSTISYIADDYRWGDSLIIKLAEAMEK